MRGHILKILPHHTFRGSLRPRFYWQLASASFIVFLRDGQMGGQADGRARGRAEAAGGGSFVAGRGSDTGSCTTFAKDSDTVRLCQIQGRRPREGQRWRHACESARVRNRAGAEPLRKASGGRTWRRRETEMLEQRRMKGAEHVGGWVRRQFLWRGRRCGPRCKSAAAAAFQPCRWC